MSDAPAKIRVLLVTSWGVHCGIAAHSEMLKASVERADPGIQVMPSSEALDPDLVIADYLIPPNQPRPPLAEAYMIHLNHHDALHSRWTPEHVRRIVTDHHIPVLVTYHDTRASLLECPKLNALALWASSVVVHEPVAGLKAIYWRQGVPAPAQLPANYALDPFTWLDGHGMLHDARMGHPDRWKAYPQQPVLGTVGFDFPWKNFDRLCQLTREIGWAIVILSNNATPEREAQWKAMNPDSLIIREYLPTPVLVNYLAGCDATAFPYECANTGTSGAIRLGIAALKPVLAFKGCRQFRDLVEHGDQLLWCEDWDHLRHLLSLCLSHKGSDPDTFEAAHRDSWTTLGASYSRLYRMLTRTGGSV